MNALRAPSATAPLLCLLLAAHSSAAGQRPHQGTDPVAVVGGTVIASPDAEPVREAIVLVQDGRIAAVGPRGAVQVPANAQVLHAEGLYVTAGFWNTHVHLNGFAGGADTLSDASLAEALQLGLGRWGFVRVLEPHTSDLENTFEIRRRIADGSVPGPFILTTGAAFDPEGANHIGLELPEIATPAEARARVRERAGQGVDAVKLMTGSLSPDSIVIMPLPVARAAVETAHAAGLPVMAHPSNEAGVRVALEAGVDVLAHVFATNVPPDWDRSLVDRLVDRAVALIPTLAIFGTSPVAQSQLQRFHELGGNVLFGTDLGYSTDPDPSSEYWLMQRAGMTPRDILASLTTAPARFFGLEGETGRIAPGFGADLVVLDGNPLDDATALARVRYVLRDGRVIFQGEPWDPAAWETLLGRPYVRLVRGTPTLSAERWDGEPADLSTETMRRYEGTYAEGEEPIRIWIEDGLLRISPVPGIERMHLVPLADGTFVQGLYENGRLVEIYQPSTKVLFVSERDQATAVIFTDGAWSSGELPRIR